MIIEKDNERYSIKDLDLDDLKALEYALNLAATKIDEQEILLQGFVPQIAHEAREISSKVSNQLDEFLKKKTKQ